jgi:hypothetical protein
VRWLPDWVILSASTAIEYRLKPFLSRGMGELQVLAARYGRARNSRYGEEWILRDYFHTQLSRTLQCGHRFLIILPLMITSSSAGIFAPTMTTPGSLSLNRAPSQASR